MARRSQKLPAMDVLAAGLLSLEAYVQGSDEKPVSLVTIDWQKIQQGYGQPIAADVRRDVSGKTTSFVVLEESERKGKSVRHVQETIKVFKSRLGEFQRALPAHGSDSDAVFFVSANFDEPHLRNRPFEILHALLTRFDIACTAALKDLSGSLPLKKEGDAWTSWVRKLNQIMKDNGLPAGVRKDAGNKSKSDEPSPFTLLVMNLQSFLPTECRRHTHSLDALATAISRALGSNKTRGAA